MAKRGFCRTDQLSRISWKASVCRQKRFWWSATANQWLAILLVGNPSKKKIGSRSSTWLPVGEVGAKASADSLVGRGSRKTARSAGGPTDTNSCNRLGLWTHRAVVEPWDTARRVYRPNPSSQSRRPSLSGATCDPSGASPHQRIDGHHRKSQRAIIDPFRLSLPTTTNNGWSKTVAKRCREFRRKPSSKSLPP